MVRGRWRRRLKPTAVTKEPNVEACEIDTHLAFALLRRWKVKTGLAKPSEISFYETQPSREISYFSYLEWLLASLLARIRVGTKGARSVAGELTAQTAGGGLFDSRYAAWSRSWQLLASTLSSCWLVK